MPADFHGQGELANSSIQINTGALMPIPIDPEVIDDNTCIVEVGSDAPHQPALWLGMLDADFDVVDAPELAAAIKELGDRYRAVERFR